MAKFWMENHDIASTDRILEEYHKGDHIMENTNRDYVTRASEYDLLCRIQNAIQNGSTCVLSAITGNEVICPNDKPCELCIGKWLNEKK